MTNNGKATKLHYKGAEIELHPEAERCLRVIIAAETVVATTRDAYMKDWALRVDRVMTGEGNDNART